MRALTRGVAVLQAAFIFPAALFLTSVLVGVGDPPQYELAHVAQRFVAWFSGKRWTLEMLLILMPFAALAAGVSTLMHNWNSEWQPADGGRLSLSAIPAPVALLFVGWATLTSAAILAVVALHMLAN
jgi:hypothetical protein